MRIYPSLTLVLALIFCVAGCRKHEAGAHHHAHQKIVVTSPKVKDVVVTQQYVCQIHSQRHIDVCALESGYLEPIPIKEGQAVKQGDLMFKILPVLFQAKLDAEVAEAQVAQMKFDNTKRLFDQRVGGSSLVAQTEVALAQAEVAKAQAKVKLARAEFNFTEVKAPFDGIVDRLHEQQGSLVDEGDMLTTLSDNSLMWVYFNVPEARYLEYMSNLNNAKHLTGGGDDGDEVADRDDDDDGGVEKAGDRDDDDDGADEDDDREQAEESSQIELVLANGRTFPHPGKIGAIEAQFNNETGTIPFRADFPNPEGLLRHGQTGNVLIHRALKNALVIPQRAVFEILDKRYVFVVDGEGMVRQREIAVRNEMDDVFVIKSGLGAKDKFVLEGVRQVHDGEKAESEFRKPDEALANQKYHAE